MERTYTEILISEEADSTVFESCASKLTLLFGAKIINHVNDLDTDYLDVEIDQEKITLHRQTFIGISIFPTDLENATQQANTLVEKVGRQLKG
jgi:hypothetical protein